MKAQVNFDSLGGGLIGNVIDYNLRIIGVGGATDYPTEFTFDISNAHKIVLTYQINANWENTIHFYYKLDNTTTELSSVSAGTVQTVTIDVSSASTFTIGGYAHNHDNLVRLISGNITVS